MKPVLYHIKPWDAESGSCIVEYKWGGATVDACRVSVYSSSGVSAENRIAEFDIQQAFQTKFVFDATHGTVTEETFPPIVHTYKYYLKNGNRYICTLQCHTNDGWSEYSDGEFFYCFLMIEPNFTSLPITKDMVLEKQVLHTTLNYTYATSLGDSMNTFELKLYEGNDTVNLSNNSILFNDSGSAVDGKLTTEIKNGISYVTWSKTYDINLVTGKDSSDFCIQAIVSTMRGAVIACKPIPFQLSYITDSFSELKLINHPYQGYISIAANLVAVEGHVYDENGNLVKLNDGDFFLYPYDLSNIETIKRNYALDLTMTNYKGNININSATFLQQVNNQPGTYVFKYTENWNLNGSFVDLADYGITIDQQPNTFDNIAILVEDNGNIVVQRINLDTSKYYLSIGDDDNIIDIRNDKYNMFFDVVDFIVDKPILELNTDYKETFEDETIGVAKFYIRYKEFMQDINGEVISGPVSETGDDGVLRYWYTVNLGAGLEDISFATSTNRYNIGDTIDTIDVWCYYVEMINETFLDTVVLHSNYFYKKPVNIAGQEEELKILFRRDPTGYYYLHAVVSEV